MDLKVQVVDPVVTARQVSWFCFGVPASLILPDKTDSTSKAPSGLRQQGFFSGVYIVNYNRSGRDQFNVIDSGQIGPNEFPRNGYNTQNNANGSRGTSLGLGNILYVLTDLHFK